MPLAPIIQPILWSYGDALHLHPHPDFLILADECSEYNYEVPINDNQSLQDSKPKLLDENMNDFQTIHVANPGNFSIDRSFVVIYPLKGVVEPSKVPDSIFWWY